MAYYFPWIGLSSQSHRVASSRDSIVLVETIPYEVHLVCLYSLVIVAIRDLQVSPSCFTLLYRHSRGQPIAVVVHRRRPVALRSWLYCCLLFIASRAHGFPHVRSIMFRIEVTGMSMFPAHVLRGL